MSNKYKDEGLEPEDGFGAFLLFIFIATMLFVHSCGKTDGRKEMEKEAVLAKCGTYLNDSEGKPYFLFMNSVPTGIAPTQMITITPKQLKLERE